MTDKRALEGVRIIEGATLAASPLMATYLAELGAEVIKVEQPQGGDPIRTWGASRDGIGLMWKSIGRNKRSVTADLRVEEGREILRRLVAISDVLIMNVRLPTLKKWKLDFEDLKAVNPRLVMVHLTGFGRGGPFSDRPGFGTLGESMSTFAYITGYPDKPPTLPPFPLADGVASLNGAYAILAALYYRDVNGGEGQLIDINLIDPLSRLLEQNVLQFDQLGSIQERQGNVWDITVPRGAYLCGDGKWIGLSGSAPAVAVRVFQAIDRPLWAEDPEFSDMQGRLKHVEEIDAAIAAWVGARPMSEVLEKFDALGVPAAPVYNAQQLLDDPHVRARQTYIEVDDADLSGMRVQRPVPRMSETPGSVEHLGPRLGAHTDEVYRDLLGMTADEISSLRERGVI